MATSDLAGYVLLASASNAVFQGAHKNDMLVYSGPSQSMYVGQSNATNYLMVTNNLVSVVGNLDVSGVLTKNGAPYQTGGGGGGGNFGGLNTVGISGALSCGTLNISANVQTSTPTISTILNVHSGTASAYSGISSNVANGLSMDLVSPSSYLNMVTWDVLGTTPTEIVRITGAGNMGIGTTSPLYPLDVAGTARAQTLLYTQLNQTSDARIKENVITVDNTWSSDVISQLRPVTYNYKAIGPLSSTVGFIAQEVEQVLPVAVKTSTDYVYVGAAATLAGDELVTTYPLKVGDQLVLSSNTHCQVIMTEAQSDTYVLSFTDPDRPSFVQNGPVTIEKILVDDFKSLDYNAVIACAISAIQKLSARVAVLESKQ
jgi:hypothetical protein